MSTSPFLQPAAIALADNELEDFIQAWLCGITGMDGQLVRPAWQPDPPPIPESGITWLAFSVKSAKTDWDSVQQFADTAGSFDPGDDFGVGDFASDAPSLIVTRFAEVNTLCSFYGPIAGMMAEKLRAGASVAQNRWSLASGGFAFVGVGDSQTVSEKIKGRFVRRIDVELALRRTVQFSYAVPAIVSASGLLIPDQGSSAKLAVDLNPNAFGIIPLDPTNPASAPVNVGDFGAGDFGSGDFDAGGFGAENFGVDTFGIDDFGP